MLKGGLINPIHSIFSLLGPLWLLTLLNLGFAQFCQADPLIFPYLVEHLQSEPPGKSCHKRYKGIFDNRTLTIRVVFGYKDARPFPFVADRHERLAFVQQILQDCPDRFYACGFKRAKDNADLFHKKQIIDKKKYRIYLQVVNSSVGPDDRLNRRDPFQQRQSDYAKDVFGEGLEGTDVVFYNGHSRSGGGPDFHPPRLIARTHVDYDYYKAEKPGLKTILEHLKRKPSDSESGAKMLGLFSCASSQHFAKEIYRVDKDLGLISSPYFLYYKDALENTLAALSALLEGRCPKAFRQALRQNLPRQGSTIKGLFK